MSDPQTVWRILGIPHTDRQIGIRLAVDTRAPGVIAAIERAAAAAGIILQRASDELEPDA